MKNEQARTRKSAKQIAATEARRRVLLPNMDSDAKIERYSFSISHTIILGEPCSFGMSNSPDTEFRPQELTANITFPGMFYFNDIRAANVSGTIGGRMDASTCNKLQVDYPTLTPANRMTAMVMYTGVVPKELEYLRQRKNETPTYEQLMEAAKKAYCQSDLNASKAILKALLENLPTFDFTLTVTGPASICA